MTTTVNGSTAPEQTEAEREVERLRVSLRESQERYYTAQQQHQADIDLIGTRLLEEAENRDWCSEYDQIVLDLNANLHKSLPLREKEYEVSISGYVRVPFTVTVTVNAAAGDDDAAVDQAREQFESYTSAEECLQNAENYNAEIDYDDLEFEAEEV